jgi:hypothetical protein
LTKQDLKVTLEILSGMKSFKGDDYLKLVDVVTEKGLKVTIFW